MEIVSNNDTAWTLDDKSLLAVSVDKILDVFLINLIILIGYLTWLTQTKLDFLGTDPYGLGQLILIESVILGHIIAGFILRFLNEER